MMEISYGDRDLDGHGVVLARAEDPFNSGPSGLALDDQAINFSRDLDKTSQAPGEWMSCHLIYQGAADAAGTNEEGNDLPPVRLADQEEQSNKPRKFLKSLFRRQKPVRTPSSSSDRSEPLSPNQAQSTPRTPSGGKDLTDRLLMIFRRPGNAKNAECVVCEEVEGQLSCKLEDAESLARSLEINDNVGDDGSVGGWSMVNVVESTELTDEANEFSLSLSYNDLKRKKLIGSGAFGMVFEAEWDGRLVALKEVSEHYYNYESGEKFIDSLKKELSVLKEVGQHENVVKCFGGSLERPHVFMLSELMDRSLGDLIHGGKGQEGKGALPPSLAMKITLDILAGLDHLHSMEPQIVHRDLKPENILLDKDNKALVADFGLSRAKAGSYLQTHNAHAGTPCYLAPEVLTGRIGEKMDIYAVGVTLWECLTGIRPWKEYIPLAILIKVGEGMRPEFPPEIFPEDEGHPMQDVKVLIEKCWNADPKERPGCKDLIKEIKDLQRRFPEVFDVPE